MIRYFERFARHHQLEAQFATAVHRLDRSEGGWLVQTSAGEVRSKNVVVATGLNAEPITPDWPGLTDFQGRFMHAADYRNPVPFRDQTVLVIGPGPSGQDIALELLGGDANRIYMSVRRPPLMFPPSVLGIPMDLVGQMTKRLPNAVHPLIDWNSLLTNRLTTPDLSAYGLDRPSEGLMSLVKKGRSAGSFDRGFSTAVRNGEIEIVPAVETFEGRHVELLGGQRLRPDAVIAATGQRPKLQPLVGHLGVLDEFGLPRAHGANAPDGAAGLYFVGFRLPPGQLPDLRRDARKTARRITHQVRRGATRGWSPQDKETARPTAFEGVGIRAASDPDRQSD